MVTRFSSCGGGCIGVGEGGVVDRAVVRARRRGPVDLEAAAARRRYLSRKRLDIDGVQDPRTGNLINGDPRRDPRQGVRGTAIVGGGREATGQAGKLGFLHRFRQRRARDRLRRAHGICSGTC